jgi:hypothetical protein
MPPRGALNAAATPAAAPTPTQFRCTLGSRSSKWARVYGIRTLDMQAARAAPIWTIGPSRPMGKPVVITNVVPTIFAQSVLARRISDLWQPLRNALRPGKPEPMAAGAHMLTPAATSTSIMQMAEKAM